MHRSSNDGSVIISRFLVFIKLLDIIVVWCYRLL